MRWRLLACNQGERARQRSEPVCDMSTGSSHSRNITTKGRMKIISNMRQEEAREQRTKMAKSTEAHTAVIAPKLKRNLISLALLSKESDQHTSLNSHWVVVTLTVNRVGVNPVSRKGQGRFISYYSDRSPCIYGQLQK